MACYARAFADGEGAIIVCKGMMTLQTPEAHKEEWERIFLGKPKKPAHPKSKELKGKE